jgi:beta-mannanase
MPDANPGARDDGNRQAPARALGAHPPPRNLFRMPGRQRAGQSGGEKVTVRKIILSVAATLAGLGAAVTAPAAAHAGATPATGSPAACVTGAKLVPSCGVLWGAAAGGFTGAPRDAELKTWEKKSGRTATIFHTYHKGDEIFPTAAEIAMTRDAAHPRILLANWRVDYGSTWAKVAAGKQDKRIDALAARAKAYGQKFFLAVNHEPEDDVRGPGSGMTAKDFRASFRHVIQRLRADGATNVVSVVAYMGNEKWMAQSWWKDLYPGDDVVDWIGLDSYVSAEKGYYHNGLFADLLDRHAKGGPGFYKWATTAHPSKPMMVAEWGAYHRVGRVVSKAAQFASVLPELAKRPAIKAIVYFDTKHDAFGDRDISIDSSAPSLAAFRRLAASPLFNVRLK